MWNTRILLVLFPFGRGSCLRVAWDWDFSRQNKVVGHGHLAVFISGAEQVAHGNRGKRGECLQWFGYQVASGEAMKNAVDFPLQLPLSFTAFTGAKYRFTQNV